MLVQPFGLGSAGGGAKILRCMCAFAPERVISVSIGPFAPPTSPLADEYHLSTRPRLRRLRGTRLGPLIGQFSDVGHRGVFERLVSLAVRERVHALHALADDQISFAIAHRVARQIDARFVLSIHDAPWYKRLPVQWGNGTFFKALADAWADADARIVISEEMGKAFCDRYGDRDFDVVTDGLESVADRPIDRLRHELAVYFAGSIHLAHHENFRILMEAIDSIRQTGRWRPRLLLRGSDIPDGRRRDYVEAWPWAGDAAIAREAESADLLYLPLPFSERHSAFTDLSLPTKLVTYLGSGRPILYHGPLRSAAARLLREHGAAFLVNEQDPARLAQRLDAWLSGGEPAASAARALELARTRFSAERQRTTFWTAVHGPARAGSIS